MLQNLDTYRATSIWVENIVFNKWKIKYSQRIIRVDNISDKYDIIKIVYYYVGSKLKSAPFWIKKMYISVCTTCVQHVRWKKYICIAWLDIGAS